ncbi:prepilin peptidase [Qipengyuania sediminis]|uniref:prepilin peptidase n=1 Tax=Qipengyuania sediminis TaxID=1532023 RepID=UPI00105A6B54|nr:prepilin peptidase [Qipengyuania sediminis]
MLHMPLYYGLLALLAIALLVATATDLRRREIDNRLNLAIAFAAPLFWWASGLSLWPGVALQFGVALAAFAIAAGLFAIGQMGGGDVKLIAALALWLPPPLFAHFLMIMAVLGYVLTMGLGAMRVGRSAGGLRSRDTVVLSALSLVAALLIAGFIGAVALPLPAFLLEAAASSTLGALIVFQLPVLALAYVSLHAIRIFRRRAVSMAAPYGVAISGAALWIIGSQFAAAGAASAAAA